MHYPKSSDTLRGPRLSLHLPAASVPELHHLRRHAGSVYVNEIRDKMSQNTTDDFLHRYYQIKNHSPHTQTYITRLAHAHQIQQKQSSLAVSSPSQKVQIMYHDSL